MNLVVAHRRALPAIFAAKFAHIPEFMFNFALVQHIEQERNNPREGYCPQRGGLLRAYIFVFCWTHQTRTRWGFSLSSKAPGKEELLLLQLVDQPAEDNQHGDYNCGHRISAKPYLDALPQGELLFHLHWVGHTYGVRPVDI